MGRTLLRGFRETLKKPRATEGSARTRPVVGVLLNIYERTASLEAGGHRHFIEVIRRWNQIDLVLFGPESARATILRELPRARFIPLLSLEKPGVAKSVDFLFRSVAWVLAVRELRRCDALLATSHFLPDVVPAVFSGRPSVVIIHHLIGSADAKKRPTLIPYISEEVALRLVRFGSRAVLASSNLVANELRKKSFRIPIRVTTSGVDHMEFPTGNLEDAERRGAFFVGRMHPSKGALDAVRAWRRVVDVLPDAVLTIMGAREVESYAQEVEALVFKSGLTRNVEILGRTSDSEKVAAMMNARVFLFPSHEEGWGIALAEAMRAGLPCVTYALPIFSEIFPQGRLEAPLGDVDALAGHVLSILLDDSLRTRLSHESSTLATEFSWERASEIEADLVKTYAVR